MGLKPETKEPIVLGWLGNRPDHIDGLARQNGLELLHRSVGAGLYGSGAIRSFRTRGDEGFRWSEIHRAPVADVADVAQRAMGVSFVTSGRPTIRADRFGLNRVWFLEGGDSVVFSNRWQMTEALAPDPTADRAAWTLLLLLGFVPPGRSQSVEVRSLVGDASLQWSPEGAAVTRPPPKATLGRATAEDVVAALGQSLPRRPRRLSVPLSGGWDSRLLAGIAIQSRSPRQVRAWTIDTDDGRGLDVELAPAVAEHLGVPRRTMEPGAWVESRVEAWARFEHGTWMHYWLVPLARRLRSGRRLLDGLAGDVLLKGLRQVVAEDKEPFAEAARGLFVRLGGRRASIDGVWSRAAVEMFEELGFETFVASIRHLEDHPRWQALAVLETRTAAGVALSPLRLFGPENTPLLPFLDPDVLDAVLSPGLYERRGPDLYREILSLVDPVLARLPSTNDGRPLPPARRARMQLSQSSMQHLAQTIGRCAPALALLHPSIREAVDSRDPNELFRLAERGVVMYALEGVGLFADWWTARPGTYLVDD